MAPAKLGGAALGSLQDRAERCLDPCAAAPSRLGGGRARGLRRPPLSSSPPLICRLRRLRLPGFRLHLACPCCLSSDRPPPLRLATAPLSPPVARQSPRHLLSPGHKNHVCGGCHLRSTRCRESLDVATLSLSPPFSLRHVPAIESCYQTSLLGRLGLLLCLGNLSTALRRTHSGKDPISLKD